MRRFLFIALLLCGACSRQANGGLDRSNLAGVEPRPNLAFGQHRFEYAQGSIVPNSKGTVALDQATAAFYDHWKRRYLRAGCDSGQYYIAAKMEPGNLTSSEATGYGMIIMALMAGHEPKAKEYFDGMLRYFRRHQSALTDGLMAWYQDEQCRDVRGDNSKTNADLDIAYALLLADKQWGSCSGVDYGQHARWVISAISHGELHREGRYMLLGDWVAPGNPRYYNGTRASDFMPGHFRGFQHFMQQPWWIQVIDNGYWLLETVQSTHSPGAGLLPEFIEAADSEAPRVASPGFAHGEYDDKFFEIAARVPLRLGADFLVSGDMRAKRLLQRMNEFVRERSSGDPSRIAGGYDLDGKPVRTDESMALTAPFGVSAMVDAEHQVWLNALWDHVESHAPEHSYEDSIRLISMLLMSGNWWVPNWLADPCSGA